MFDTEPPGRPYTTHRPGQMALLPTRVSAASPPSSGARPSRKLSGQRLDDRLVVVHATTPEATADRLESRPAHGVRRKIGISLDCGIHLPLLELQRRLLGGPFRLAVADQVEGRLEAAGIDHDPDQIAVAELADRSALERFRPDVSDTGSGRHAGEAGVRDQRDPSAGRWVATRRCDIVGVLSCLAD